MSAHSSNSDLWFFIYEEVVTNQFIMFCMKILVTLADAPSNVKNLGSERETQSEENREIERLTDHLRH